LRLEVHGEDIERMLSGSIVEEFTGCVLEDS
jgi:hypothetical protein